MIFKYLFFKICERNADEIALNISIDHMLTIILGFFIRVYGINYIREAVRDGFRVFKSGRAKFRYQYQATLNLPGCHRDVSVD